jgi:hypothetical protein
MGPAGLERNILFNESETLQLNLDYIRRELSNLKVSAVEVIVKEKMASQDEADITRAQAAIPGSPAYRIV